MEISLLLIIVEVTEDLYMSLVFLFDDCMASGNYFHAKL